MSDAVRGLMRRARSATLATALADEGGRAYASLVTVACDVDASPILLLSRLAEHTRNLEADPRASLLFENASGRANPQTGPRATVMGTIQTSDDERHARRFLARHPSAARYAGFGDFAFYTMSVERVHYVGGFSRAIWMDGANARADRTAVEAIAAAEPSVLDHMNADHADAIDLYANRLLDRRGAGWTMVAVDPEGCDLRRGHSTARLDFPEPVEDAGALREVLVDLARQARSRGV